MSYRPVPKQQRFRSEQVVCTPVDFLAALKGKLGIHDFSIDLAAGASNAVTAQYYSEYDNALIQNWKFEGWGFCNPPFGDLQPWVEKALSESRGGAKVAMMVPASVGSSWWGWFVHESAYVLFLHPRLTFVGHTSPYPKDLAVLLYAPYLNGGYDFWDWK